ncbi:MAG: hypothetical protein P1V35_09575, partial [Planctomycetota bacterium]|nr:hypothetical protein [Planctomycetota bacterium]
MPPIHPTLAQLPGSTAPEMWSLLSWPLAVALGALAVGVLRRSLENFTPNGVLDANPSLQRRERLIVAMERAEALASGARWIEGAIQVAALGLLFTALARENGSGENLVPWVLGTTFACMVLWVMIPRAIARARADGITSAFLPTLSILMYPFGILFRMTSEVQDALARLFGMR